MLFHSLKEREPLLKDENPEQSSVTLVTPLLEEHDKLYTIYGEKRIEKDFKRSQSHRVLSPRHKKFTRNLSTRSETVTTIETEEEPS